MSPKAWKRKRADRMSADVLLQEPVPLLDESIDMEDVLRRRPAGLADLARAPRIREQVLEELDQLRRVVAREAVDAVGDVLVLAVRVRRDDREAREHSLGPRAGVRRR